MTTEAMLQLYRRMARLPDLKSAYLASDKLVESVWSTRNLVTQKHTESVCRQRVDGNTPTSPTYTPLLDNVQLIGRWQSSRAWLVQSDEGTGESKKATRYVLVQQPEAPPTTIDLSRTKLHGKVYADGELGCLEFSPDGTKLAFVAEQYTPKGKSFLDTDGPEGRGDLYLSRPDWGEQFTGKHRSVVVIVPSAGNGVEDEERVLLTPPDWCAGVGQLQWAGPDALVGVAYVDASPRLGLVYCRIREAVLFYISLRDKIFRELTPRGDWVGSPRLTPDGASLVYLRGPTGGPHVREAQLLVRPWGPDPEIGIVTGRVVVDTIPGEQELPDGAQFPGVTGASSLPLRCFLAPHLLVLSTQTRFAVRSFVVCIETGSVALLGETEQRGSVTALDVVAGRVLCSLSSFTASPSLCLAAVSLQRHDGKLTVEKSEWVLLVKGFTLEGISNDWVDNWLLADKPSHPDAQYASVPVPVSYCGPRQPGPDGSKRPLVSLLHGGPHSAASNSFVLMVGVLLGAGYSLVIPNYRGSLGVGSAGIHSLLGHVGSVDVNDCHAAVLECLKRHESVVDPRNVFLCGGSHGGFLVTSLSAKHPDFYRAVSSRNPVTDIATMAGVTDIPDWTHVEAGSVAPHTSPPPAEVLSKMAAVSPMWAIDAVRAPTLLLLGTEDRRVPLSQGMKYHQLLKRRGVPTRVHVYPDCHSLTKVDVELDCLMHTLGWYAEHKL